MENSKTIDPENYRCDQNPSETLEDIKEESHEQTDRRFLKGPIHWLWLVKAGSLKGKALQVAVSLCFRSGINKSTQVSFSQKDMREMGIPRSTALRGLNELEKAGLVAVEPKKGGCSSVTLLGAFQTAKITNRKN